MEHQTDPLDLVPQIPADWANHIVYGGVVGLLLLALFSAVDLPYAPACAAEAVLLIASAKKVYDYFVEHETVAMCVGKAVVTAVWPASIAAVVAMAA